MAWWVDIAGLRQIIAPRLLARRRGGGMTWIHNADPRLPIAFRAQEARRQAAGIRGR